MKESDAMNVLFVHFRLPFYSIAKKSFQVRSSLLLPPPSALKGALAKGLALLFSSNKRNLDELAKELVAEINRKLIDTIAVFASPPTPVVRNYFLLKRLRTLEPQTSKKGKSEFEESEEGISEKTDAMRREYIFSHEIYAIYIFKNLTEEEKMCYKKAATLIDTLGDTESLVSVINADFVHIEKVRGLIEFYVPISRVSRELSKKIGVWRKVISEDMQIDPEYGKKETSVETFYLPLEEKKADRHVYYEINPIIETDFGIRVYDRVLGIWIPENFLRS
ncbi:MAG: type I-A CRISPR-associated protein Cas5a [Archaeoglobaceae archaeon]|nr:type I-A CRISPR-associated protein Cas5a [Archaeoglobaceae archaeon]